MDYLAFKEVLLTYLDSSLSKSEVLAKIMLIKSNLKSQFEAYISEMPKDHTIRITSYWLLGLIEGDGITSRPHFWFQLHITAYNKQKLLLLAINYYIDHLNLGDSAFIKRNLDKFTPILSKISFNIKE